MVPTAASMLSPEWGFVNCSKRLCEDRTMQSSHFIFFIFKIFYIFIFYQLSVLDQDISFL